MVFPLLTEVAVEPRDRILLAIMAREEAELLPNLFVNSVAKGMLFANDITNLTCPSMEFPHPQILQKNLQEILFFL